MIVEQQLIQLLSKKELLTKFKEDIGQLSYLTNISEEDIWDSYNEIIKET